MRARGRRPDSVGNMRTSRGDSDLTAIGPTGGILGSVRALLGSTASHEVGRESPDGPWFELSRLEPRDAECAPAPNLDRLEPTHSLVDLYVASFRMTTLSPESELGSFTHSTLKPRTRASFDIARDASSVMNARGCHQN